MKTRTFAIAPVAASAAAIIGAPGAALAQQADTTDGARGETLQEIVVFGRSVVETTLDIPQSVDVLDAEMLEATNTDRIGDALRFVPGASADGSKLDPFGDDFLIRGFGSSQTVNGIGVNALNHSRDAVNVERIEVLKGPASVLYGQLEPGAVINIVTKQPLNDFFAEGSLEAGRYDAYRGTIDITGPITADRALKFRLTGAYSDAETFVDFWSKEHVFVAPVLSFEPGDDTTITLEALYSRDKWQGSYNGMPAEGTVLPNPNGTIPRNRTLTDPSYDGTLRENTDVSIRVEHRFSDNVSLRGAASWTNGEQDYEEIFGVLGWEESEGAPLADNRRRLMRALLDSTFESDTYAAHVDLSFAFDTGPLTHQFALGADYERRQFDSTDVASLVESLDLFDPVYSATTEPAVLFTVFDTAAQQSLDSYGVFFQDRIAITEQLKLIGGMRYSKLDEEVVFTDLSDPSAPSAAVAGQKPDKWTSQVGVLYSPTDSVSIFASRTTSFLAIQGSVFGGDPLEPETGTQYELGVKTAVGRRLTATIAAFDTTRGNVAVSDRENPTFSVQVGEQTARGIEASINALLTDNWRLYAGYAYTDTEVTEDTDTTRLGKPLLNVAKNTFALFTQYDVTGGVLQGLQVGGGINYVDDRAGDFEDTFRVPSYWQADLFASYRLTDQISLRVNVDNATDEEIFEHGLGIFEVWPGAPRTYRASITFRH